jgi:hypothetical protein
VGATYVYGIIPSDQRVSLPGDGVSAHVGGIHTVPHDGIAAVVGPSDQDDYQGLPREELVTVLLEHQRVVEEVMSAYPVLPARFGTVLADEARVIELLTRGHGLLAGELDRLAGCVQMEVVVQWDLEKVFAELGRDERIAQVRAAAAAASAADAEALRIVLGQTVQALLEERRATLKDRLLPRLQEAGREVHANPLMDDKMILNLALLVDEPGRQRLDALLPELDDEHEGSLDFRCVGPLPPYTFATLDVESPRFSDTERARGLLELPLEVTAGQVKAAFRRLASRLHPDVNPDAAGSEEAMAELAWAYKLLSRFVDAACEGETARLCRLDRPSVEQALLFDIRRQEA